MTNGISSDTRISTWNGTVSRDGFGVQGDLQKYVNCVHYKSARFTDRFMLRLTFIRCYNGLIMMMSPHEHVAPVR